MPIFLLVIAIALIAVVAGVGLGLIRGGLDDPRPARADDELPPGRLSLAEVAAVRFGVGLRGYRMDEVDDFVDRMLQELRANQTELHQLRAQLEPEVAAESSAPDRS